MHHHPPPPSPAEPTPTVADDLAEAARAFFPDARRAEPVRGHDHLVRVVTAESAWGVRRWPAETTAARIAFVHAVLGRARAAGLAVAPAVASLPSPAGGETMLARGDRRYDARAWLPGRTAGRSIPGRRADDGAVDLPTMLSENVCVALAEAVARLHLATEELARTPGVPTAPLAAVVGAVEGAWAAQRARLRPVAPKTPPVQRWLAVGERAIPAALAALERGGDPDAGPRVALHLNLWPAHVLLDGEAGGVVGLLGWEGTTVGSPLLDLAQLVTRCRGWSAPAAELVLAAYAAVRPLSPEERRLLPAVAALDLVAAAGRLLDLADAPRADDDPIQPTGLRAGAESFVASLEAATAVVAQGDAPLKSRARRWQHRPRAGDGRPGGGPRPAKPDRSRSDRPRRPVRGGPAGTPPVESG